MNKVKEILKFAMRMEKDAWDFYSYNTDKAQSTSTKQLFEDLAETEKKHYNILKSKYDELGFEDPPITISWVVDSTFTARDPHILADISDTAENNQNEVSDLSIIRMAYLIESDFSLFYKNAVNAVDDPEAKEFLSILSEWEEHHRQMFHENYQKLLKEYWGDISSLIFPG